MSSTPLVNATSGLTACGNSNPTDIDISEQCAHYEKFAVSNYKDDPFPMTKQKLLRYIKVRARCSTFCDYMSDLEKHPLHGPAWLNNMNTDPDVRNLMRMCLMLWPRQAKQCQKPLIGIGLINESGIFEDAWTNLRKEKEREQALLNEKVRVINGPKAKGYMVTDKPTLPTAIKPSSTQPPQNTASSISQQLKQLGNTPNQPIDLEKTPAANLTTFYVEADDALVPQNDSWLRRKLKEEPVLLNREVDLLRKARMKAFETVAKFRPKSPATTGETVGSSSSAKKNTKKAETPKKKKKQEAGLEKNDVYTDDVSDDFLDDVDYTHDIMDDFDQDLFDSYQIDEMIVTSNGKKTRDKGKRKADTPDTESNERFVKNAKNNTNSSNRNEQHRIEDSPQYETRDSDGKKAIVVINQGLEDMYHGDELTSMRQASVKQSVDLEHQIMEPTVVIPNSSAHRHTATRRLRTMKKRYEPTVLIRHGSRTRERRDYFDFSKRSYATKNISRHRTLALRHAVSDRPIQSVFSFEHLSPSPSASSSTSTITSKDSEASTSPSNSLFQKQPTAASSSFSALEKSTSTARPHLKRPIKFFKRPVGRPRKIPFPQAIVRIKLR